MILGGGMETPPALHLSRPCIYAWGMTGVCTGGRSSSGCADTGKRIAWSAQASSGGDGRLSWVVRLKSIP